MALFFWRLRSIALSDDSRPKPTFKWHMTYAEGHEAGCHPSIGMYTPWLDVYNAVF